MARNEDALADHYVHGSLYKEMKASEAAEAKASSHAEKEEESESKEEEKNEAKELEFLKSRGKTEHKS